ncbi:MAG: universal stress protein [Methanobrevibacter sp.]
MYKKVLLPTDGSEFAEQEICKVKNVLDPEGEVVIVSVAMKIRPAQFQSKENVAEINKSLISESEAYAEHMKVQLEKMGVNSKIRVVCGRPAEKIEQVANDEGVDLIIISSSGKTGLHKFIIGSVAEKVLSIAKRDVLLVHE